MAWTLDSAFLRKLISQNVFIRLRCMLVDGISLKAEPLGYLMLDLKSLDIEESTPNFRVLGGVRHGIAKPEVRLSFLVENNYRTEEVSAPSGSAVVETVGAQQQSNTEQDFLHIGSGVDTFNLSITLSLIGVAAPRGDENYSVKFNVFGVEITTEDLRLSTQSEKFEFLLKSSLPELEKALLVNGLVSFFLYKDGTAIGQAPFDMSDLVSRSAADREVSFYSLDPAHEFRLKLGVSTSLTAISSLATEKPHQYRLAIDLHSFQLISEQALHIYAGYSYPAIGTSSPIYTLPPVYVTQAPLSPSRRGIEPASFVRMDNGFSALEFIFAPPELDNILAGVPLEIEVWSRRMNEKDVLFGKLLVDLSCVYKSGKKIQRDDKTTLWAYDQVLEVFGRSEDEARGGETTMWSQVVGNMRLIVSLEDFGAIQEPLDSYVSKLENEQSLKRSTFRKEVTNFNDAIADEEEQMREDLVFWLHDEKKRYKHALADFEAKRLSLFKVILSERLEMALAAHRDQCLEMDEFCDSLHRFFKDLMAREMPLQQSETLIRTTRIDMEKKASRKQRELELAYTRLKQELDRQVAKLRMKRERVEMLLHEGGKNKQMLTARVGELMSDIKNTKLLLLESEEPVIQLKQAMQEHAWERDKLAALESSLKTEIQDLSRHNESITIDIDIEKMELESIYEEELIRQKKQLLLERLKQERSKQAQENVALAKEISDIKFQAIEAMNKSVLKQIDQERKQQDHLNNEAETSEEEEELSSSEDEDEEAEIVEASVEEEVEAEATRPPIFPAFPTSATFPMMRDAMLDGDERALVELLNARHSDPDLH